MKDGSSLINRRWQDVPCNYVWNITLFFWNFTLVKPVLNILMYLWWNYNTFICKIAARHSFMIAAIGRSRVKHFMQYNSYVVYVTNAYLNTHFGVKYIHNNNKNCFVQNFSKLQIRSTYYHNSLEIHSNLQYAFPRQHITSDVLATWQNRTHEIKFQSWLF